MVSPFSDVAVAFALVGSVDLPQPGWIDVKDRIVADIAVEIRVCFRRIPAEEPAELRIVISGPVVVEQRFAIEFPSGESIRVAEARSYLRGK